MDINCQSMANNKYKMPIPSKLLQLSINKVLVITESHNIQRMLFMSINIYSFKKTHKRKLRLWDAYARKHIHI